MPQVSLFIGGIRPLPESGRPTGIYKQPVTAVLTLGALGFVGDQQADRRVHGGPDKAVHLYPAAHYSVLARRFPEIADQLCPGSLGENLSTSELDEQQVCIGDTWKLGDALLQVSQPRSPCWKIDERFATEGMARFIAEQRLTGWYWRVIRPGTVAPGDALQLHERLDGAPSLAAAQRLCQTHRPSPEALESLAATPGIAAGWQEKISLRAAWLRAHPDVAASAPPGFHMKPDTP